MNEPATSAPPSGPLPRLEALEAEIQARIREFDLTALLDLLAMLGYGADDIVFRGHLASGPRPSLLHAIAFPRRDRGARGRLEVVVTVNLGLMSCRSPLPSYFQRFLSDLDTRDPVLELLEVLDRSLLHERLTRDRPERALATWPQTQRDFLRIFGLDSPLGLRWLFRQVFPELGVRAQRIGDAHSIPYQGARLGESKLGECSFGDRTRVGVHDMEITLLCEDAIYQAGVPWIREGARRLRTAVFPLLDEICMTLTVAFVLLEPGEAARIGPPSATGYNPMGHPGALLQLPPTRIELHRGALPPLEPDSDQLERMLADTPSALEVQPPPHPAREEPAPVGLAVDLLVTCSALGHRPHRYLARVHWGARAWYRDDPFAIALRCEHVPKRSPTRREHPRLWSWLLHAARMSIAARLTEEVLATTGGNTLDDALIERLITERAFEHLHALAWSTEAGQGEEELSWEDAAWQRFVAWSSS